MARRLDWSDVRGGLIASVAIVVLVVVVFFYSRVGALHGETITLYAVVAQARGVSVGSEVWLSGQKIGKIEAIRFRSPTESDTSARLVIAMRVLADAGRLLRRDAVAQIQNGGSVIGTPVLYLSPGTALAPAVREGDTLHTRPQADLQTAMSDFALASREFPAIIGNVKTLAGELQGTRGTVGAFLNSPPTPALVRARAQTSALLRRLGSSRGTVGAALHGDARYRVQRVLARVDSVRALLASPHGSLGRFRRDSTLLAEVEDIRVELEQVRSALGGSDGTAGRILHDSAIVSTLADAQRQMTLLFADLKKHPFRYLSF